MKRTLVFGWGNPSRGDDALGVLCVERLRQALAGAPGIEFLDDYQLMVEHALDLVGRERVLFVDASVDAAAPFQAAPVHAARDASHSSHALSARALLQVYVELHGSAPPPCTLLAIRGTQFELGAPLSPAAGAHLDAAVDWALHWVRAAAPAVGPAAIAQHDVTAPPTTAFHERG